MATKRDIAQLRQHTHLLCQIAQSIQNRFNKDSEGLDKLLQAMTESGSYPNLDFNLIPKEELSCIHQQSKAKGEEVKEDMRTSNLPRNRVSLYNIDDGTLPPSPLFAPSPETEETEHADCPLDSMSTSVSFSRFVPEQRHRSCDERGLGMVTCHII
ncbi:hypothetical protein PAMP_007571 [Pampus punctatissimus]